jgi:UDP-N-acetylglucosamine--N-acetylmuramyl-(pentapeptide) pyrophosphoryl-undecaprenol N-acetylglucosamine transferase
VPKEHIHILIAAGGTGGHVFPALAIADEMKKINPSIIFLFVGTKGKIETRVVPKRGYSLALIWISGFHRTLRLENILFPIKVIVSLIQSFMLIKKFHPDVVVGTGGYVSGPILLIALLLNIPTIVHESNSYPGVTTRLVSNYVTYILTAFEATTNWLKRKDNVVLVGTPTDERLGNFSRENGIQVFNFDKKKKVILVFGGSLGATSINNAMKLIIQDLIDLKFQIIWQVGKTDEKIAREMSGLSNCRISAFIDNMEYAYAAADVVVCRAGATTIAEITRLGKPSILIPYPYAAADHQTFNAKALADVGAALMIPDREVTSRLKNELVGLINDTQKLQQMSETCRKFGKPDAGQKIASKILELVK